MVTIKQVSELAKVSSATVSRVINNADSVKLETRKLVEAAMKELGYRPNSIAQSLASNKTNTVGYVVPQLYGSFGIMMSGSEEVLRRANKHMFIMTGHSNEKDEKSAIEALLMRRCDALILHLESTSDEYLIELAKQKVPFVLVNRVIEAIEDNCISLDNHFGGYLASKALIDKGHRDIAYIAGSLWKSDAIERLQGHKEALAEANIAYDESLIYEGDFQVHSGVEGIETLLNAGKKFSAVACGNDEMASGAIGALRDAGLKVPESVSVVGFDDVEFSNYLTPRLTTIRYPMKEIGQMAARWILNRAYENSSMQLQHVLSPHLIERESVCDAGG
ncbi:LacI family DNA-binding transcriptional regulator [Neptunicella marina]|uniref:LacI family DNA-binding transcriptional regulator n=1 Tax=Neptunicella marina TaxID=2125989 RepID=A0A8J6IVK0_9ALTE|nr:LacI family DNA-binding transcriptional regulator [Neptunicella marina]MBC3767159.1 LacI family DNA-binding transcriptional regulator [Neptunicella marina]